MGNIVPNAPYTPSVYEFTLMERKGFSVTENIMRRLHEHSRVLQVCMLVFLWLLGLIIGVLLSIKTCAADHQHLYTVPSIAPSFSGVFFAAVLPIMLCLIGIYTDCHLIIGVLILVESVCRGFCGFWMYLLFGSGGWLLRSIFMFLSSASIVLMWMILLSYITNSRFCFFKITGIVMLALVLFVSVDFFLISPFLVRLSMYF